MRTTYTVGEFAKLWGMTRQTLIYYDNIGLLPPTFKNQENNHRFYSVEHYHQLEFIHQFQSLSITLATILDYKKDPSQEKLVGILTEEKLKLQRRMADDASAIEVINNKLKLLNHLNKRELVFEEFMEQRYLKVIPFDTPKDAPSKSKIDYAYFTLLNDFYQKGHPFMFNGGALVSQKLSEDMCQNACGFYIEFPYSKKEMANLILPAGKYLSISFEGDWDNALTYYQALKDYAQNHALTLIGDFFEEFITYNQGIDDYKNYLYKLSIRVK